MGHGIADDVYQRIRNLLDDIVVEFRRCSTEEQFYFLPRHLGRVAYCSRQPPVEIPDWHHTSLCNLILKVVCKLCELVDIRFDAAHKATQLSEHFIHVSGYFGQ